MRRKKRQKDKLSKEQRSALMARVRGKDTKPELIIRKLIHAKGFRFRLHKKGLPGSPDIVFASRKKVIFVHGCFWHRHPGCKSTTTPNTRRQFWLDKFEANVERDARNIKLLSELGWRVLVVWACEIKHLVTLEKTIFDFLVKD